MSDRCRAQTVQLRRLADENAELRAANAELLAQVARLDKRLQRAQGNVAGLEALIKSDGWHPYISWLKRELRKDIEAETALLREVWVTMNTELKAGDRVTHFRHEAEVVIADLSASYWTRGARIKYTTGDQAGNLADVPVADLRPLAQDQTADAKARVAAEAQAAKREAWRKKIREDLIAKAAVAAERTVASREIDVCAMSKAQRDTLSRAVTIATNIHNEAIVGEAIDRVVQRHRS